MLNLAKQTIAAIAGFPVKVGKFAAAIQPKELLKTVRDEAYIPLQTKRWTSEIQPLLHRNLGAYDPRRQAVITASTPFGVATGQLKKETLNPELGTDRTLTIEPKVSYAFYFDRILNQRPEIDGGLFVPRSVVAGRAKDVVQQKLVKEAKEAFK